MKENNIFEIGKKYSKMDISNVLRDLENINESDIDVENGENTLKINIKGIEIIPSEYRIDMECLFEEEAEDVYIFKEAKFNEVVTNVFPQPLDKLIYLIGAIAGIVAIVTAIRSGF